MARVQVPAAPSMLSMANINKLWKAMIAPNSDMVEREGHWYGKPSEIVRPVRKEVLAQNTAIIEQIHPIIKNLPRKETAANRRRVICEELAKLGDDESRKLGAMKVIPADVFASRDAIPRRSCKDEARRRKWTPRSCPRAPRFYSSPSAGSHQCINQIVAARTD